MRVTFLASLALVLFLTWLACGFTALVYLVLWRQADRSRHKCTYRGNEACHHCASRRQYGIGAGVLSLLALGTFFALAIVLWELLLQALPPGFPVVALRIDANPSAIAC